PPRQQPWRGRGTRGDPEGFPGRRRRSSMALSLAGKVVFVTGASAGIGAGCARAFADLGARLLLLARRGDRLAALAPELRELGAADVHWATADVRDFEAVAAAYAGLPPSWQEVEVLVNNAGLSRGL